MGSDQAVIPLERIESKILLIRGQKVMLDSDLAALYEVEVKALNQAVKRNIERFPEDFMFHLTGDEAEALRSQIVTLEIGRGKHRKFLPYAFTEQGVAMLSSVLRSKREGTLTPTPLPRGEGLFGKPYSRCSHWMPASPKSSPNSKRNTTPSSKSSSTPGIQWPF